MTVGDDRELTVSLMMLWAIRIIIMAITIWSAWNIAQLDKFDPYLINMYLEQNQPLRMIVEGILYLVVMIMGIIFYQIIDMEEDMLELAKKIAELEEKVIEDE